jgi:hypothetical protein
MTTKPLARSDARRGARPAWLTPVAFAWLLGGCASIVGGQKQHIAIVTRSGGGEAAGAHCLLRNDKGTWQATTPGSVTVQRSHSPMTVDCRLERQAAATLSVAPSTRGIAFSSVRATVRGSTIGSAEAAYAYPDVITLDLGRYDSRL